MVSRDAFSSSFSTIAGKIASGAIPLEFPAFAGGDWGGGRPCAVCDDAVRADQAEVQAHFRDRTLPFHARCFIDWWEVADASGGATAG